MNFLKKALPYFIILALSFLASKPLLAPGFFPIHDDTQVARVFEMTKALKDGMLPVRWSQHLGYGFGYPVFNFYDPFAYYLGGLLGVFGADALLATKLMVILAILFSSFSMYLFAKEFWGKFGSVLSSALYVFAPYHAVDLYVRGDFAEAWAYSFIPLIFYGLWKIHKERKWKYVVITSLAFGLTILSHNLTALMVSPFLILFAFYLYLKTKNKKEMFYFASAIIFGILISAFYSLPAILELNYTNIISQIGGGADFRDHYVCLNQLWASPWGFGGSVKGCVDGISFMIGKYNIIISSILFILSLILLSKKNQKDKEKLLIVVLFFVGFLISGFLTLDLSRFVWETVKPMEFFQYPWRFLMLIVFFSSFVSGALPWILGNFIKMEWKHALSTTVFIVVVLSGLKFFSPQTILNKTASDYTNSYSIKWIASKTSDEYMPKNFRKPQNYSGVSSFLFLNSKDLQIRNISQKTQELNFDLIIGKDMFQVFPLAYFPSWKAYLDGRKMHISEDEKGIRIDLPKGQHSFKFIFAQTPIELFSTWFSVLAIVSLFGYNALKKKHE